MQIQERELPRNKTKSYGTCITRKREGKRERSKKKKSSKESYAKISGFEIRPPKETSRNSDFNTPASGTDTYTEPAKQSTVHRELRDKLSEDTTTDNVARKQRVYASTSATATKIPKHPSNEQTYLSSLQA